MAFDGQATRFDERAGLPISVAEAVAVAIVEIAGVGPRDLLVEVGAGSGEIGGHLVGRVEYLGFDIAGSMLAVFRDRLGPRANGAQLVVADGDAVWPVEDRSARAIFGSRSLHLLSLPHLLGEIHRVGAREGVTLLIGRIVRDETSVRMWMRRQMRRLLRDHGIAGRPGGNRMADTLVETCLRSESRRRAEPLEPRVIARWSTTSAPADSLAAWAGKDGLAGIALDVRIKGEVLERLAARAAEQFGDLDRCVESSEEYVLTGVRFSPEETA